MKSFISQCRSLHVKVRQNVSKHFKVRQMCVDDDENAISKTVTSLINYTGHPIRHKTPNTNKELRSRTSNAKNYKKKKLKSTVKKNSVEKRHLFGNSILTQTQFKLNSNSTQARNPINSRSLEFEAYPASHNVALKSREHLTLQ